MKYGVISLYAHKALLWLFETQYLLPSLAVFRQLRLNRLTYRDEILTHGAPWLDEKNETLPGTVRSVKVGERGVFLYPTLTTLTTLVIWNPVSFTIFGRFSPITAERVDVSRRNFNTWCSLTRRKKWDAPRYRRVSQSWRTRGVSVPYSDDKKVDKKNLVK